MFCRRIPVAGWQASYFSKRLSRQGVALGVLKREASSGGHTEKPHIDAAAGGDDPGWLNGETTQSGRSTGSFKEGSASWAHIAPPGEEKLRKMARQSLLHELWQEQQRTHEVAVDWFLNNMPASYFRQTTEEARLQHLGAISAMLEPRVAAVNGEEGIGMSPTKDVKLHFERIEDDRKEVTFIQPGIRSRRDGILTLLQSLPLADGTLQQVQVFPSRDGNIAIHVFGYVQGEDLDGATPGEAIPPSTTRAGESRRLTAIAAAEVGEGRPSGELFEYAASLQAGEWAGNDAHAPAGPMFEPKALLDYISRCEPDFVQHSHPRRFCKHRMLYEQVTGTEGIAVDVEAYQGSETGSSELDGSHWISLAAANVLPKVALSQALRLLKGYQLETVRCHLDVIDDPGNGSVTMIRLLVGRDGLARNGRWSRAESWAPVKKDLRRIKWLDERVYDLALERHPGLGLERAELIFALADMVYGALNKQNPWAYSKSQIHQWLNNPRYVKHAAAVADFFCQRFRPDGEGMSQDEAEEYVEAIRATIRRDVEDVVVQGLIEKMLDGVMATYRTNFYMPNRWALSLRVNPRVLMTADELKDENAAVPFGVFFAHGRRFNGFHCRFRDIARGGMRIVTPPTKEQVAIEAGRHFDETYGLAFAQQLKNKDIPEGGSKAVLLADTTDATGRAKHYAVRKGVKAFSDALLDLLVKTEETHQYVRDLWGKQELLYLGPDEQVIPQDINWIVRRAAQREAPFPSAFMSSKPDAGINHKDYGVTSEGVFVFLDEALRDAGVNAKAGDQFTLKLTGGPDGDVGGNMIKIVDREYGASCLIVGVADGTGSAEDPAGLDHGELLRLFRDGQPIAHYSRHKLGPDGVLHTCDTEEGIRARNTMHSRVKADAFVPAGGRPGTIDVKNWRSFLDEDGRPSSPLVVEGANLFTTPEARELLFKEAGVVFVKDSSANKCGVICSSFEIISSMLMAQEEFKAHKEAIVEDVLERLRVVARQEAELLFREHRNHPATPLPVLSERISNAINAVTDAVLAILDSSALETAQEDQHMEMLMPLFREHLPKKLVDLAFDRVPSTLPRQYQRNAMASCLAGRVVYTEGINFIDAQPRDRLGELAFAYIKEEAIVRGLAHDVETDERSLSKEQRARVVNILKSAGVRVSLGIY